MKQLLRWLSEVRGRQDIVLAVMLMTAVFMMILPLPTLLVDILIAINLALSLILLMTAVYVRDPLDLTALPSLLLITTLYRLALTVSTSRLILLQHDAGDIVYAFGNFVVGGNLAVGIIVFSIITIVQFIVITKGAERVAEVGARFSLDAMPGKQMSIDGDLRAGTIDSSEAKRQRSAVQKESQLYGAMDGAMKFVKGDAIAGIIVILVNILGGMVVGVMQHGMSAGEAVSVYAVLSIGDGLIAQIPALIISIAAGIVVTRVPGDQRENLAKDLATQFSRQPHALMIAAVVLGIFAIVPGFPFLVFAPLALLIGGASFVILRGRKKESDSKKAQAFGGIEGESEQMTPGTEPVVLLLSSDVQRSLDMAGSLEKLRWSKFERLGIALSKIPVKVSVSLPSGTIDVLLYNEPALRITPPEKMALVSTQDHTVPNALRVDRLPFGGFKLQWLDNTVAHALEESGVPVVRAEECVAYAVSLVIDRFANEFIGVQETRFLMDAMEAHHGELVKELQRQLPVSKIAEVLQRLVAEGISIRDLRTVFEALIEWAPREKDSVMLSEYVRVALRRQIIGRRLRGQPKLGAWLIGEGIENMIRDSIRQTASGAYSTLPEEKIEMILAQINSMMAGREDQGGVLVTAIDVRRFVRKFLERDLFRLPVLSFQELGDDVEMRVLGVIEMIGELDNAYA